jgi:hypothetical protein
MRLGRMEDAIILGQCGLFGKPRRDREVDPETGLGQLRSDLITDCATAKPEMMRQLGVVNSARLLSRERESSRAYEWEPKDNRGCFAPIEGRQRVAPPASTPGTPHRKLLARLWFFGRAKKNVKSSRSRRSSLTSVCRCFAVAVSAPRQGLEPWTRGLTVRCSTN